MERPMTTSQADDHRALYDGLYREGYRKGLGHIPIKGIPTRVNL